MLAHGKGKNRSNSYEKRVPKVFMADAFAKDLKNGKLPYRKSNQRIANFGQGFSNMLQLVAQPRNVGEPYKTQGLSVPDYSINDKRGSTGPLSGNELQEDSLFE